jgi:hypothetical protein
MLNKTQKKAIRIHTFKGDFYAENVDDDLIINSYDIKEEVIQINGFYYDCSCDETFYEMLYELHGSCCKNLEKIHKRYEVVFIISINEQTIEIEFDDEFVFSLFEYEPYDC